VMGKMVVEEVRRGVGPGAVCCGGVGGWSEGCRVYEVWGEEGVSCLGRLARTRISALSHRRM